MRTIEGQVFVRTQGAETIKLSLVDVQLFDAKAIAENVEKKRRRAEPIYEAFQPLLETVVKLRKDAEEAMNKASDAINQPGDKDESFPDKIAKWKKDVDSWTDVWKKACEVEAKTQGMSEYPRLQFTISDDLPQPLQMTKTGCRRKVQLQSSERFLCSGGRLPSRQAGATCVPENQAIPANGVLSLDDSSNCRCGTKR